MSKSDFIVVGVGAAGSAAVFHLARRGARVVAFDRHSIPNDRSSHSGATRIIRQAYFEHPDYVPLLRRAYALWNELESVSSQQLMFLPGIVYAGPRGGPLVSGCLEAAKLHGIPVECVSERDVQARLPGVRIPRDHDVLFEPSGGYLRAEEAIRAHVDAARAWGAAIREYESVIAWGATREGVWVETTGGRFEAEALVLAAGPWMAGLARLPVGLTVTRQTLVWTSPDRSAGAEDHAEPVWAMCDEDGSLYYGFPMNADGRGYKSARHYPGAIVEPDSADRSAPQAEVDAVLDFLSRRLPGAAGPVLASKTCLYTSTPDQHFIIDRHPGCERVVVASPCSGHGFKFAPVIGEAIADLCLTGQTTLPIGFLSLRRFGLRTWSSSRLPTLPRTQS